MAKATNEKYVNDHHVSVARRFAPDSRHSSNSNENIFSAAYQIIHYYASRGYEVFKKAWERHWMYALG